MEPDKDALRKKFAEVTKEIEAAELSKDELDKIKFSTTDFVVIEIPTMMGIKDAWGAISKLIMRKFEIKGVIEREYLKTSWVLLQKKG